MVDRIATELWKHPIDRRDFTNIIAEPVAIQPGKNHFFETKDSESVTGHSLRAKVRMTFAGIRTKNRALYLPDEHFKSTRSFITPYPKPVQVHHKDELDPIGRVIDVRYVDTTNEAISVDSRIGKTMQIFKDAKAKPVLRLGTVPTFLDLSRNNSNYRGVGHILGLWDITDPEAIKKFLDGRYLTVSTGMAPRGAYCSACALNGEVVDWAKEMCDHERGDIVDGVECVAVPFDYEWDEVSPVNHPASPNSQVIEVGHGLSFADAVQKIDHVLPYEVFSDFHLSKDNFSSSIRLKDGVKVTKPLVFEDLDTNASGKNTASVIGEIEQRLESDPKGQAMKLSDLIKDTASNYEAIAKHLDGAARLTGDFLKDLDDQVFLGPNRTFPIKDLAHAEAAKALLAEVEDSDAKATLVAEIEDAITRLTPASEVAAEEDASEEPKVEDAVVEVTEEDNTMKVTVEAWDALKAQADKVADLELDRDLWKNKAQRLATEVASLTASHNELLKDHKGMLAEALVETQLSRGAKIEDKVETLKKYSSRSLESLRDSLEDWKNKSATGTTRQVSGEQVADPRLPSKDSAEEPEAQQTKDDAKDYSGIVNQYYELYYDGVSGPARAKLFLLDARNRKLIPENVNP